MIVLKVRLSTSDQDRRTRVSLPLNVSGRCYDIYISPPRERTDMNKNDYYENYEALCLEANFGQIEQASVWYLEAEKVANKVFSLGEPVTGLSNNLKMAKASLELGYEALRGPKTNAFARAIAGDESAVVIDVWMCRAAGCGVDSPNKTQYTEMSEAVAKVAERFQMTPRTAQALIWIMVRGSGE